MWKFDRQIFSIEGIKLLFPIKPKELLYFIVSLITTGLLVKYVPFMNQIPWVVKYLAMPYGMMKFLTKQKLDGKLPHKFFIDYMIYKLSPKEFVRFKAVEKYDKPIIFSSITTCRRSYIINKTQEALKDIKRKLKKKPIKPTGKEV